MLVMQGANDPRVIELESAMLVDQLRAHGKQVEFVVYKDEGHDVLKFANKVHCYNTITDFFAQHLQG
jgi:dipeptidyl aminopeptidase/acylaminoacyl peptidase